MTETINTILNPEEAAKHLGISYRKLLDLFNEGKIPGTRVSERVYRFHRDQLDEWIKNGGNNETIPDSAIDSVA